VLIDRDGVAHVADFGLARAIDVGDGEDATTGGADEPAVTQAGLVIGTPPYLAPEQLDGGAATPASDQFAFCVALHRALHGVAPFPGDTPTALRARIAAAPPEESDAGKALPRWLRSALAQGLAANPAARHASMTALVALLARERGWRRWRVPVALGTTVIAATAAVALASTRSAQVDPADACDGGANELAAVWNPAQRSAVATRLERSREGRNLVLAALDRQARTWTAMHRSACVAPRPRRRVGAGARPSHALPAPSTDRAGRRGRRVGTYRRWGARPRGRCDSRSGADRRLRQPRSAHA
jgi:serine/threonine protein kinase